MPQDISTRIFISGLFEIHETKKPQIVIHNKMNKLQHMHEIEYCMTGKNK